MEIWYILVYNICILSNGGKYILDVINKIKEYFNHVNEVTQIITHSNINKIISCIKQIHKICEIDIKSATNRQLRDNHEDHYHPIKVFKGDIYNAQITQNAGSELSDNHLVVIVQGFSSNVYGEKVTVLPIEGDGTKINPHYQIKLTNADLESGQLDKNPSRIIFTDVMTLDKARLDRKIGKLNPKKIQEVNRYLVAHLDLKSKSKSNKSSGLTTDKN